MPNYYYPLDFHNILEGFYINIAVLLKLDDKKIIEH